MEVILLGLWVNLFTRLTSKLKISGTVMAVIFALIGGALYYVINQYYPTQWEQALTVAAQIYATSQVVYGIIKKVGLIK